MYPNDPNQPPQAPPPGPQPNPGWGQPQQPVTPQQSQQPSQQPQRYPQPIPQQPTVPPTIPSQNPLPPQPHNNFNAIPQPMAQRKLPTARGPFALLLNDWMKQHWKLFIGIVTGIILLGLVIFQLVYPNTRLLPGANVDGAPVGGMRKDEAAKRLNELYGDVDLSIYFGKNDAAFLESKLKETGVSVVNENRIAEMNYPFYLKLIPGSIFWANGLMQPGGLEYAYDKEKIQSYTESKVGDTCTIPAKDATLKLSDSQLQVVPSVPGAECDITEFQKALSEITPVSTKGAEENQLRIDSTETPAAVDDDKARELADVLNKRLKDPMPISLGSESQSVPGRIVMSWLDFKSDIPEKSLDNTQTAKLVFGVNNERMSAYLSTGIASKVVKKPGVSKVSTLDFTETSRVNGAGGTELDMPKIVASVTDYINGKTNQAVAVTHPVGPTMVYTRKYTPTSVGYKALLTQFAQDNPGTYGLAITELGGVANPRSATYNADAKFPSAGAESLYIGYSVMTSRHSGELRDAEEISNGRKVDACLKDMYIKSDEGCRIGFYERLTYNRIAQSGAELGLQNTTFANRGGTTSANDLQKVLVGLFRNQIARNQGGQQLLTLGRNIRSSEGIPVGVTTGEVSHFVGENETIRNDAAVVYSNKGVYALTVMSDGSSWDKIVNLTKKIQDFKQMKIPKGAR